MHRLYLKLQIAFWGLVFLALFVPHRIAGDLQGWVERDLVGGMLFSGAGVFVSHLCYRGLLGGRRGERVPMVDPGALRWALSAMAITAALLVPGIITQSLQLGPLAVPELTLSESLRLYFAVRSGDAATIALGWLLGCSALFALSRAHAADTHRLAVQLEMERQSALASEARLAALHARVQPHFLFNAMNTIRALIVEQPDVARQAVTDLAYLMRQTLNAAEAAEHTIEDEVRIVEAYLNLEKLRFAERLRWRCTLAKDAAGLRLPPL
jgi:Histidine kinase